MTTFKLIICYRFIKVIKLFRISKWLSGTNWLTDWLSNHQSDWLTYLADWLVWLIDLPAWLIDNSTQCPFDPMSIRPNVHLTQCPSDPNIPIFFRFWKVINDRPTYSHCPILEMLSHLKIYTHVCTTGTLTARSWLS